MGFDRHQPYNTLPDLPPAANLETRDVLRAVVVAGRAVAELKGLSRLLPDQALLINTVVLREAQSSSAIENIVTTQDELYRALDPASPDSSPAAREVARYREALWHGFNALQTRPLSVRVAIEMMQILRGVAADVRKVPGIRIANAAGEAVYTPPAGEVLIRAKLANLEHFIHADDGLDPLIKMAVMHYQFEAIHPFSDGNGRTGRLLNLLYLVEQGLLDWPILFLSGYILEHRAAYYTGLRQVTETGDWEPWLLYMLEAIAATAVDTQSRITAIRDLLAQTMARVQEAAPTLPVQPLVEFIFRLPYARIGHLVDAGLGRRQAAARYLRQLEQLGILRAERRGRDVYFVNDRLLAVLAAPTGTTRGA